MNKKRKPRVDIIIGGRYGRLIVLNIAGKDSGGKTIYECLCDCGNKKEVIGSRLNNGNTGSCGCLQEYRRLNSTLKTHGEGGKDRTAEYVSWMNMMGRCYNKNNKKYYRYGARGIIVCERWHDYSNFLSDMGRKPSDIHTLDREDNDGNYELSNCRWSLPKIQSGNRSTNHWLEYKGERMILEDWARKLKMTNSPIRYRLKCGESFSSIVEHYSFQNNINI